MLDTVFSIASLVFVLSVPASISIQPRPRDQPHLTADEPPSSFCSEDGWNQEWGDEFSKDTLGEEWAPIISTDSQGDKSAPVSGLGVTACRSARCRAENVRLKNGHLILRSERDEDDRHKYFTGAVTTRGLKNWKDDQPYRLCISAKLPGGQGGSQGIWPAHWMLPDNGLSERCLDEGEVDIMEMINGDGGAYSTYHYLTSYPNISCGDFNTYHKSRNVRTSVHNWQHNFHEYGIERSKDHINYAIDGKVVHHMPVSELKTPLSHSPFFLILNTAVGGGWPGEPTPETKLPAEHVIDYVRVSRRSSDASPGSFSGGPLGQSADDISDLAKSASWADAWKPSSVFSFLQTSAETSPEADSTLSSPPPLSLTK